MQSGCATFCVQPGWWFYFRAARLMILILFLSWQLLSTLKGPDSLNLVQVHTWGLRDREITYDPTSFHHNPSLSMKRRGVWKAFPFSRLRFSVLARCPGRTGFQACTQWNAIWTLTLIRLCLFLFSAKAQHSHKVKRWGSFILAGFLLLSLLLGSMKPWTSSTYNNV